MDVFTEYQTCVKCMTSLLSLHRIAQAQRWCQAGEDEVAEGQQYSDIVPQLEEMSRLQCYQLGIMHGANTLIKQIWHKESEHPDNRHPYPVLNPNGEMAFAFYDELYGWQFDREFKRNANMLWLDIERVLPKKD